MKKNVFARVTLSIFVLAVFVVLPIGGTVEAKSTSIILTAGPMGGPWYSSCTKISEVLMRDIPGLNISVIEGGARSNLDLVNVGKDAQIGMTSSSLAYPAITGSGKQKTPNVKALCAIVTSHLQIGVAADSDIKSIDQLLGKRIAPGANGFISEKLTQMVLKRYGMTYDDIRKAGGKINFVKWGEYPQLFQDGHIDAFTLCGEVPHAIGMQIETSKKFRLLPIKKDVLANLLSESPFYFKKHVKAGIYKGQKEDIDLIAYAGVLVVHKSVPDELVTKIVKTIENSKDEIVKELPFVNLLGWDKALSGLDESTVHPAALKLIKSNM